MHKLGIIMMLASSIHAEMTLFINARVYDGHSELKTADALLVENDRFLKVGRHIELSKLFKPSRIIDLHGARVLPGFIEAHGHLLGVGQSKLNLDLRKQQLDDILKALGQQTKKQPRGSWIQGRNWDQNLWPTKSFPTATMLDGIADEHPVYLRRVDGHAAWVNSKALNLAGIDKFTKDPDGGQIIRDHDGNPTGVLIDHAMALVSKLVAQPAARDLEHFLSLAMQEAASVGITSFHDAGVNGPTLELFKRYAQEDKLTVRIYAMLDGDDPELVSRYLASGPLKIKNYLSVRSIKYFADGALGSRGALLLEDYADQPGLKGLALISQSVLEQKTRAAIQAGFQVATHAIGDQATRLVLDAYAQALRDQPKHDARLRVEHAQLVDPNDHHRFRELGVVASMQPVHCTSDMAWVPERLGKERLAGRAYPWRSLLDHRAVLAFGSDAPVEPVNPMLGLYAAVSRANETQEAFLPEQKLTMKEALNGFFEGAAYAEFNESHKGRIAEGYLADFVVFDEDILQLPKTAFLSAKPKMTVVGGRIVFERP